MEFALVFGAIAIYTFFFLQDEKKRAARRARMYHLAKKGEKYETIKGALKDILKD